MKTAALMGAGAVGAFFIYYMQETMGDDFCLIAEGNRAKRLLEKGVTVNGKNISVKVKTPEEAHGVDLLIIATKYDAMKESLSQIKTVVGEETQVLVVLNGIDSEDIVGEVIGREHVIRSFMRIVSARDEQGSVFNPEITPGVIFGEDDKSISPRVSAVDELLTRIGVPHVVSGDIISDQWNKYAINVSNNLLQAVLGVGYHAYFNNPPVVAIHDRIMDEVRAVGAACGIKVTSIPTPPHVALPEARFSTLQDIDNQRKTEVDMFLGVFLGLARKAGVDTPFCEYTYYAIKALESKYL